MAAAAVGEVVPGAVPRLEEVGVGGGVQEDPEVGVKEGKAGLMSGSDSSCRWMLVVAPTDRGVGMAAEAAPEIEEAEVETGAAAVAVVAGDPAEEEEDMLTGALTAPR